MTPDPVDAAIAAAGMPPMAEIPIRIASTGRLAALLVPEDLSESELAELAGWMLTGLLVQVRARAAQAAARTAAGRIIVPS